jgi:hypothetical protein
MSVIENLERLERVRLIVPDSVDEKDMNCDGRLELDSRLSQQGDEGVGSLDCTNCVARAVCLIGLGKGLK